MNEKIKTNFIESLYDETIHEKQTEDLNLKLEPTLYEAKQIFERFTIARENFSENPNQIGNEISELHKWIIKFRTIPPNFIRAIELFPNLMPLLYFAKPIQPMIEIDGVTSPGKIRLDKLIVLNPDTIIRILLFLLSKNALDEHYFKKTFFYNFFSRVIPSLGRPFLGFDFIISLLNDDIKYCLIFLRSKRDKFLEKLFFRSSTNEATCSKICDIFATVLLYSETIQNKLDRIFSFMTTVLWKLSANFEYCIPSFFDLLCVVTQFPQQPHNSFFIEHVNIPSLYGIIIHSQLIAKAPLMISATKFLIHLIPYSVFDRALDLFNWNLFQILSSPPDEDKMMQKMFCLLTQAVCDTPKNYSIALSALELDILPAFNQIVLNSTYDVKSEAIIAYSKLLRSIRHDSSVIPQFLEPFVSTGFFEAVIDMLDITNEKLFRSIIEILITFVNLMKLNNQFIEPLQAIIERTELIQKLTELQVESITEEHYKYLAFLIEEFGRFFPSMDPSSKE